MASLTPIEFEARVWKVEKVRIIVRCPFDTKFEDYPFKAGIDGNATVTTWVKNRLDPITRKHDFHVEVINGKANPRFRRSCKMSTLRATYK